MATYTLTGDAPLATRFVRGINMPQQPASYLSGRRGAVLATFLDNAGQDLGKNSTQPYSVIGLAGVVNLTTNGNYTLSRTPTISAGFDGQHITIINQNAANTVTFQDDGTLAGSALFLSGTTVTLSPKQSINLVYNATLGGWLQTPVLQSTLTPTGVYLPLHTLVANLTASTRYNCQWARFRSRLPGTVDMVQVTGKADLDATTTLTVTKLGIQLPIASNLAAAEQCAGTANCGDVNGSAGVILGDVANARAELRVVPVSVTNDSYYFTFMYQVL